MSKTVKLEKGVLYKDMGAGLGWVPCSVENPADSIEMAAAYDLYRNNALVDGIYELTETPLGPRMQRVGDLT